MKVLYRHRGERIGKYQVVSLDPVDKMLSGSRGFIVETGKDTLRAYLVLPSGSEKKIDFNIKHLDKRLLAIGYPVNPSIGHSSADYANNPNLRHEKK